MERWDDTRTGGSTGSSLLSWDECVADDQGVYQRSSGSRTVTENERTLILISLARLVPGTSSTCPSSPPQTLLVEAAGAITRYVSSFWGGCSPVPGGIFVRNFDGVYYALQNMVRTT
jgi:hypothetical protein